MAIIKNSTNYQNTNFVGKENNIDINKNPNKSITNSWLFKTIAVGEVPRTVGTTS